MLDSFPIAVAVGTVLGFLAGLGIGGGSLLILWLTMVLHMPHSAARGINLLFFLPAAVICACFRCRQGKIPFRKILPAIISGCIAAAVFSYLSVSCSFLATDSLRPSSQSQIAPRFGYKYATGIFALRVAPLQGEPIRYFYSISRDTASWSDIRVRR